MLALGNGVNAVSGFDAESEAEDVNTNKSRHGFLYNSGAMTWYFVLSTLATSLNED